MVNPLVTASLCGRFVVGRSVDRSVGKLFSVISNNVVRKHSCKKEFIITATPRFFFLMCSRNRLEIRENPDNLVPDQWYKDEGGRENCVELQVRTAKKRRTDQKRKWLTGYHISAGSLRPTEIFTIFRRNLPEPSCVTYMM